MSYWRTKAHAVITASLKEGREKGLEGKDLERHVSEAYPWGERANHPYKIWCNVFALLVRGDKKPMSRSKAKKREADDARVTPLKGQGEFEFA